MPEIYQILTTLTGTQSLQKIETRSSAMAEDLRNALVSIEKKTCS